MLLLLGDKLLLGQWSADLPFVAALVPMYDDAVELPRGPSAGTTLAGASAAVLRSALDKKGTLETLL